MQSNNKLNQIVPTQGRENKRLGLVARRRWHDAFRKVRQANVKEKPRTIVQLKMIISKN
jgi:hypothetical protein